MIRNISNILNKIFFTILNHTIFFPFSSIVSAKMYLHCKYPRSIYPFKYPSYITLKQNHKISCELANKCNRRSPRVIKRIIKIHTHICAPQSLTRTDNQPNRIKFSTFHSAYRFHFVIFNPSVIHFARQLIELIPTK